MTKATDTALTIFASCAVYFALYAFTSSGTVFHDEILPCLPFWALVSFGAYALGTLGWGVLTFKDKKNKYEELLVQIDEAKEFYKTKGLTLE